MKITQGQYFEIEDFFTKKCKLVETEFIDEMMDHFIDGIEAKVKEGTSFESALIETSDDFGGVRLLRKMEWDFQKSSSKKEVKAWVNSVRSYFSTPKLYRSIVISALVFAMILWIQPGPSAAFENLLPGFIYGFLILPASFLFGFLFQHHSGFILSMGPVKIKNLINGIIPGSSMLISILLFFLIVEFIPPGLPKIVLCSIQISVSIIVFISSFMHFNKEELENWYRPSSK